jgi:multidrug transporter EmrE-like cation transporter
LGYLLLYRNGGHFSISSTIASSFITLCLFVIGVFIFKDHITFKKILGLCFCVTGIILINNK